MQIPKINLNEYKLPYDSFIGGWYLPDYLCDGLIEYHKKSDRKVPGRVNSTKAGDHTDYTDSVHKVSTDVFIDPLDTQNSPIIKNYMAHLGRCLKLYCERYDFVDDMSPYGIVSPYNIQHYKPTEGFKSWHYERGSIRTSKRVLVFMTYLNDVDNAGTEFFYQKLVTPAKKGLTVIWPTDFTHTHRGVITEKDEKYICTGWFELLDDEQKKHLHKID